MHGPGSTELRGPGPGRFLAAVLALVIGMEWASTCTAIGAEPAAVVDYLRDVKPLLSKRCYACHGALKQRAGAAARHGRADARRGRQRAGRRARQERREPDSRGRHAATRACGCRRRGRARRSRPTRSQWFAPGSTRGRRPPADEHPQADPAGTGRSSAPDASAGSPDSPPTGLGWVRNPIDAFLAAEHEKHGLTPSPEAEPAVLIRRVYLDLIGLLPTPEEVRAFVDDPSDQAYEAIVDRLLASPQYGERWGRHWMDVWRYSDWDGYGAEVRESQPHIWRWRDWIVESLNADVGYDQMVVAMLAADEAAPGDADALRATGYPGPQLVQVQPQRLARYAPSSTPPRRSWASRSTAPAATTTSTTRSPSPTTTASGPSSSLTRSAPTACPASPTRRKTGLVRVYDSDLETPTYPVHAEATTRQPDQGPPARRPAAQGAPDAGRVWPIPAGRRCPGSAYYPGSSPFVQRRGPRRRPQAEARRPGGRGWRRPSRPSPPRGPTRPPPPDARPRLEAARKGVEAAQANLAADEARIDGRRRGRIAEPPRPTPATRPGPAAKTERPRRPPRGRVGPGRKPNSPWPRPRPPSPKPRPTSSARKKAADDAQDRTATRPGKDLQGQTARPSGRSRRTTLR